MLKSEGNGDGGLFKGIMIRYFTELILTAPTETKAILRYLEANAEILWQHGKDTEKTIFNHMWSKKPNLTEGIDLSIELSGVMLFECLVRMERQGLIKQ